MIIKIEHERNKFNRICLYKFFIFYRNRVVDFSIYENYRNSVVNDVFKQYNIDLEEIYKLLDGIKQ